MKLYAEMPVRRALQVAVDVGLLVWIYVFVRIGIRVDELVSNLAEPGRALEGAGGSLSGSLDTVADRVGRVPVAGGALRAPFRESADAARTIRDAGATQADVTNELALWLGVLVAGLPILWALARYLPGRVRWVREATAASQLRSSAADRHLFALRAVANRSLPELRRASADPAGDLERGDYAALAEAELRSLGLRPG